MKYASRTAVLLGVIFILAVGTAHADGMLDYVLTAQGSSTPFATWEMPVNPTPSCPGSPCFVSGDFFAFNVDISFNGGAPVSDTLVFMNTGVGPINLNDVIFQMPEFTGDQLYTGDESAPQMKAQSFTLTDDGTNGTFGTLYTLNVTAVPEPSSLLLLGSGLLALSLGLFKGRVRA